MRNNDTKFERTKKEINSSNIILPSEKKEANSLLNILKKNNVDPEDFLVEFDYFKSAFDDLNKMSTSDEGYWELDHEIDMSAGRTRKMMKGWKCSGENLFNKEIDNVRKYVEEKRKNLNEKSESSVNKGKNLIDKEERTFCSIYCLSQHAHTYDKREIRNLDRGETVKKSYGKKDTIFSDREKALNKLEEYQTWLDFRNGEAKVVEYAVSKVKYDITDLLKNGEVSSEDDFIEKIGIYPNKFNEYETENEVLEFSKMEFCVNVYDKDDKFDKKTSTYVLFGRYGEALDFAEDIQNGTYNDLDNSEIIAKVLFRNENVKTGAELRYPLFDDYTIMTSDEFDEMFEKRLNRLIENNRSGQSM